MERRSLLVAGKRLGSRNDPEATLTDLEQRVRALVKMFEGVQLVLAPELHLMALPPMLDEMEDTREDRGPGPRDQRLGGFGGKTAPASNNLRRGTDGVPRIRLGGI